jgi:hypothetical protein
MGIEERRSPRITVDFFADWGWGPECEYYDRITSLSLNGCFLATRRELESGQEIYLRWNSDRLGQIIVRGAVRYQLRLMEGAQPSGAGIEFLNVPFEVSKRLQSEMERYTTI